MNQIILYFKERAFHEKCCSSWYDGISSRTRERLDVIHRRMIRFVFSFEPRHHVDLSHFKRLSWLCISDRVKYFKLIHVFKVKHGLAPSYLSDRFKRVDNMHSYNTRGSKRNFSVSDETCNSLKSFSYTAVKEWNLLPSSLKELNSIPRYRYMLYVSQRLNVVIKQFLHSDQFTTVHLLFLNRSSITTCNIRNILIAHVNLPIAFARHSHSLSLSFLVAVKALYRFHFPFVERRLPLSLDATSSAPFTVASPNYSLSDVFCRESGERELIRRRDRSTRVPFPR